MYKNSCSTWYQGKMFPRFKKKKKKNVVWENKLILLIGPSFSKKLGRLKFSNSNRFQPHKQPQRQFCIFCWQIYYLVTQSVFTLKIFSLWYIVTSFAVSGTVFLLVYILMRHHGIMELNSEIQVTFLWVVLEINNMSY